MSSSSWGSSGRRRKRGRGSDGSAEAVAPATVSREPSAATGGSPSHHGAAVLVVPRFLLHATYEAFIPYSQARVEAACFWFGLRGADGLSAATTLVLPRLYQTPGSYSVVPGTLGDIARSLRAQGLTNLAQVHTHPDASVEHSTFDDAHAYSTQDGALSIVWPHYGRALDVAMLHLGIHERRNSAWERLSPEDAAQRIRVVETVADFRWAIESGGIPDEE